MSWPFRRPADRGTFLRLATVARWWQMDFQQALNGLSMRQWDWLSEEMERLVRLEEAQQAKLLASMKAARK